MEVNESSIFISGSRRSRSQVVEYTVKEYAHRFRVTERTVYTWISKRAVEHFKTPGGHWRIVDTMK